MNKILTKTKNCIITTGFLITCLSGFAQDQCKPVGWADYSGTTTGGGNATPVTATTYDELKTALTSASVKVVYIKGVIVIPSGGRITIQDQTGKSVIGLPGSRLTSSDQAKSSSGIMYIKGSSNVILRNIVFQGPGSKDVDGYDNLTIEGGNHLWVDHCDFIDGLDGNFDIKRQANYVAVTWCKFSYTSKSSGHQFSNLIGHDDAFTEDKGFLKITFQYNWWADGVVERMPRIRFGQVHVVNNYFSSTKADYNIAPGVGADVRVENNLFGYSTTYVDLDKADGNTKVTSTGNSPNVTTSKGTAFTPPYTLQKAAASAVKSLVTSSCGAGATIGGSCGCVTLINGINETDYEGAVSPDAYPNPFTENIKLIGKGLFNYTIYTVLGTEVSNGFAVGETMVGKELPKGIYLVKLNYGDTSRVIKIEKN